MNKEQKIRNAFKELVGKGNLEIVRENFEKEYAPHAGANEHNGHSYKKRIAGQLRTPIPDVRVGENKILAKPV